MDSTLEGAVNFSKFELKLIPAPNSPHFKSMEQDLNLIKHVVTLSDYILAMPKRFIYWVDLNGNHYYQRAKREHFRDRDFTTSFLWHVGFRHLYYYADISENRVVFNGLQKLHQMSNFYGDCWQRFLEDKKASIESELETLGDPKYLSPESNRKIYLKKCLKDGYYLVGKAYIRIYGERHPWNHISVHEFTGSRELIATHIKETVEKWGVYKVDLMKVKQDSNFEPKLPALSHRERLAAVDEFIDRRQEKNRSNNNERLRKYLTQCVDWYHGKPLNSYKTCAEYRVRWKKHVEWILDSPATTEELGFQHVDEEEIKPRFKLECDEKVVMQDVVYQEVEREIVTHSAESTTVKFYEFPTGKVKVVNHSLCECKNIHEEYKFKPSEVHLFRTIFNKAKEEGRTLDTFNIYGRRDLPNTEEEYVFVTKKTFKRCFYYPKLQKENFSNYYAVLGRTEEIADNMPVKLSPFAEDMIKLNNTNKAVPIWEHKQFKQTLKQRNSRKKRVQYLNKKSKHKDQATLKQRMSRLPPRERFSIAGRRQGDPVFKCETAFIRKVQARKVKLDEYVESKGFDYDQLRYCMFNIMNRGVRKQLEEVGDLDVLNEHCLPKGKYTKSLLNFCRLAYVD